MCACERRNARETCHARFVSRAPSRKDAEPLFRETLERRRAKLGDAHPDTLASAKLLGVVLHDKARILDEEGASDPATLARLYTESADLLFPQFGEHKQIVRCRKRAAELLEAESARAPLAARAGLQTAA